MKRAHLLAATLVLAAIVPCTSDSHAQCYQRRIIRCQPCRPNICQPCVPQSSICCDPCRPVVVPTIPADDACPVMQWVEHTMGGGSVCWYEIHDCGGSEEPTMMAANCSTQVCQCNTATGKCEGCNSGFKGIDFGGTTFSEEYLSQRSRPNRDLDRPGKRIRYRMRPDQATDPNVLIRNGYSLSTPIYVHVEHDDVIKAFALYRIVPNQGKPDPDHRFGVRLTQTPLGSQVRPLRRLKYPDNTESEQEAEVDHNGKTWHLIGLWER